MPRELVLEFSRAPPCSFTKCPGKENKLKYVVLYKNLPYPTLDSPAPFTPTTRFNIFSLLTMAAKVPVFFFLYVGQKVLNCQSSFKPKLLLKSNASGTSSKTSTTASKNPKSDFEEPMTTLVSAFCRFLCIGRCSTKCSGSSCLCRMLGCGRNQGRELGFGTLLPTLKHRREA